MKNPIYLVNGKLLPEAQAKIPVMDLGILRGYGIFDFTRTYNQKPFYLDDHLKRLRHSAKLIDLYLPWTNTQLKEWINKALKVNNFPESQIRIVVTGGETKDTITPQGNPTVIILVNPAIDFPQKYFLEGVKAITYPVKRLYPEAKTINYISGVIAIKKADSEKAFEAIYIDEKENILEGTTSNFFAFKGDTLVTAKDEVLAGVTRAVILKLARNKFKIQLRQIKVREIPKFSECFLTASNKEVMPVVQIDDHKVNDGKVGPNTKKIMELFKNLTKNY